MRIAFCSLVSSALQGLTGENSVINKGNNALKGSGGGGNASTKKGREGGGGGDVETADNPVAPDPLNRADAAMAEMGSGAKFESEIEGDAT